MSANVDDSATGDAGHHIAASTGPIGALAALVGAPEPAFRLLLSILAGYPIAAIYRKFFQNSATQTIHMFFALSGFLLVVFNYGFEAYHSAIAIWITYLLVRLLHHTSPSRLVIANFVFHMGYLLIGYYYTESDDYDIKWTMPHCVLVLRLIGFAFDVADGRKSSDELSKDQKETALRELPSLLELAAYTYFPSSVLVGPQFPFVRYQRFVNGEFIQFDGCTKAGLIRGGVGFAYLAIRQIGAIMLPDNYPLSDEFGALPYLTKLLHLGIWGRIQLYKYISCWLITEGALICCGFTYAGKTADGKNDWSGCSNVHLMLFETGSKMTHYIQSFNVNTNHWVAQYIYKRLKFLNNRTISYAGALIFLAVWHGFHSGYYMAFCLEYAIVTVERQFDSFYKALIQPRCGHFLESTLPGQAVKFAILKVYNVLFMAFCLLPFCLLNYERWSLGFSAVKYFGFILLTVWAVIHLVYEIKFAKRYPNPLKRKED